MGLSATDIAKLAQICALGGAVKSKALTDAKRALPERAAVPVDFLVRIAGNVTKELDTPATESTRPAKADLFTRNLVSEVLRLLGIGPKRLAVALREASAKAGYSFNYADSPANAALLEVFEQVAGEVAARLPAEPCTTPGRAAAVRTDVSYTIVEQPCTKKCAG